MIQVLQKMCSHLGVSMGSNGIPKQMGHSNAQGLSCNRERLGGAEEDVMMEDLQSVLVSFKRLLIYLNK